MKDIIRMNQLAGIITEGQARKMIEVLDGEVSIENLEDQISSLPLYDENDKENTTVKYGKYVFLKKIYRPDYPPYYFAYDSEGIYKNANSTPGELLDYLNLKNSPSEGGAEAKILTNVYYIEDEGFDLKRKGLEEYYPYSGGAVTQAELEEAGLYNPNNLRKIGFLYIRKGSVGTYDQNDNTFEDEEGNTTSVDEKYIKYL
jgi:hypothetical protein